MRKRVLTGKIKRLDEFFEECYRLGLDKEVEGDTNIKLVPGAYRDLLQQQTKSILQKEWEELRIEKKKIRDNINSIGKIKGEVLGNRT